MSVSKLNLDEKRCQQCHVTLDSPQFAACFCDQVWVTKGFPEAGLEGFPGSQEEASFRDFTKEKFAPVRSAPVRKVRA